MFTVLNQKNKTGKQIQEKCGQMQAERGYTTSLHGTINLGPKHQTLDRRL